VHTILLTLLAILFPIVDGFAQERLDAKDRIAAIVNDDVITLSELPLYVESIKKCYK